MQWRPPRRSKVLSLYDVKKGGVTGPQRRDGFRDLPSTCEDVAKKMGFRLLLEMHVRRTNYNDHKF